MAVWAVCLAWAVVSDPSFRYNLPKTELRANQHAIIGDFGGIDFSKLGGGNMPDLSALGGEDGESSGDEEDDVEEVPRND